MAYELKLSGKYGRDLALIALIDDADIEAVSRYKWNAAKFGSPGGKTYFYAVASSGGKGILLHRFLLGAQPGELVDHIDHDTLNYQRSNLRICTRAQNVHNSVLMCTSTTGFKGVTYRKKDGRYTASIRCDGRAKFLGSFSFPEEAADAYREAAIRLHGEFASFS